MGYLTEERETHLYYDPVFKQWTAYTNMPNMRDRFERCGWRLVETTKADGEEVDWKFVIYEPTAITIRDMTKPKRQMSPQQLEALRQANAKRYADKQSIG